MPVDKAEFHVLGLPPSVVEAVRGEQRAKLRGEVSEAKALDAHATLARLKVAVGLMWMNGRTDKVSEEDWELSGVVMGVSNSVRAEVQAALRSNAAKSDRDRGRRDADREVAKTERLHEADIARVAERIRHLLRAENDRPKAAFRRDFGRDKPYFDDALSLLVRVGDVDLQPIPGKGNTARSIHLVEGR